MKLLCAMTFTVLLIGLWGCGTGPEQVISPEPIFIGDDPFNDLTVLDERFYLTNFDLNEGSGKRINLYSFDLSGQPVAAFNLSMNGQGFISICSDGDDLFLFCRTTGLLLRIAPTGDLSAASFPGTELIGWQAGGLLAMDEEIFALLWNGSDALKVNELDPENLTLEEIPTLDSLIFPYRRDFRSLCGDELTDMIYLLCSDSAGIDYLEKLDGSWKFLDEIALADSHVAGITWLDGEIWVSTEDRRIIPLSLLLD